MTHCGQLFEKLDKLLNEKLNIDDIGKKLCDTVQYPRRKTIGLIKIHKSDAWLIENADWLGYGSSKVRKITTNQNVQDATKNCSTELHQIIQNVNDTIKYPLPIKSIFKEEKRPQIETPIQQIETPIQQIY